MSLISRDGNAEASTSYTSFSPYLQPAPLSSNPSRRPAGHDPPSPALYFLPSASESGRGGHGDSSGDAHPGSSSPTTTQFRIPRKFHSMASGAGAGLVSSIVTCPLDVIKTRLQAQHLARDAKGYEGARLTCERIWRQSGFKGFYRGLGPTLAGYLPTWGIYFTVYDLVKDRCGSWFTNGGTPALHVFAAMLAGGTGTILTNPLWVVKTRFMAQAVTAPNETRYRSTIEAFTSIYRTEGPRAFYKGLLPSLMGVSHVAVQFPLYEKAKEWAVRSQGENDPSDLSPSTILLCSAISKMVASLATYPHEVLRTRLQIRKSAAAGSTSTATPSPTSPQTLSGPVAAGAKSNSRGGPASRPSIHPLYSPLVTGSTPPLPLTSLADPLDPPRIATPGASRDGHHDSARKSWRKKGGILDTIIKIKRQDGWRGFYRGLSINLIRTVPNSAVTMLTYELIMRRLSLPFETS